MTEQRQTTLRSSQKNFRNPLKFSSVVAGPKQGVIVMKDLWKLLSVGAVALTLGACNTVEGVGQDVESAGEEIEETANENK